MPDKIKVYGKAQNRTALGIFHAYMVMYPHATLADLRKAFPNSLNPDSGTKEIFIPADEKGTTANWDGYFKAPDEIITTGDGQRVAVVKMWTKPSIERLVNHAHAYDVVTAQMLPADPGAKKGGYRLEYLNGYVPPKPDSQPGRKGLAWWVWAIIGLVAAAAIVALCLAGGKDKEVVVEKPVVVEKVVHDTLYVQQVEDIERDFNAAQFEVNKADLNDDAKLALHDLAKVMKQNPDMRLAITGHTSAEGDAARNLELSRQRAQAAVDFLVNKEGIDASRLTADGRGSQEPVDPDKPETNRRTEFTIID